MTKPRFMASRDGALRRAGTLGHLQKPAGGVRLQCASFFSTTNRAHDLVEDALCLLTEKLTRLRDPGGTLSL